MFTKSLITAGLFGLALCTQPAAAHPARFEATSIQPAQRLVQYADLDLASSAGQATLDARLRRAAAAVCEANYGSHPLTEGMEAHRCYRKALDSAHRQMASIGNIKMVSR